MKGVKIEKGDYVRWDGRRFVVLALTIRVHGVLETKYAVLRDCLSGHERKVPLDDLEYSPSGDHA